MDENTRNIIVTDLATSSTFHVHFTFHRSLGYGSDGEVSAFHHLPTTRIIAVKTPRADRFWTAVAICQEAKSLAAIGLHDSNGLYRQRRSHQNIAHMLAYQPDFGETFCPAIFFECAEFGNLLAYRTAWRNQEAAHVAPYGIREATVWKLFRDLVSALDFLHNKCGFLHRDVKSENVLVFRSPDDRGSLVPTLPVFKLCDFSRAVAYPALDGKVHSWAGTTDYAPPLSERLNSEPARPAGDMWSLGATIQEFALGVRPIQSRKALISVLDKAKLPHPELEGEETLWKATEWRDKFSAAYRPLNLSAFALGEVWEVDRPISRSYVPFSNTLEVWYKKLFEVDHKLRATSAILFERLVPRIDKHMLADEVEEQRRIDSVNVALTAAVSQTSANPEGGYRQGVGALQARKPDQAPSYEGNGYSPLS